MEWVVNMRINKVNNYHSNFKSNLLEQSTIIEEPVFKGDNKSKKEIILGLTGLAIIGAAAVTTSVLKKRGIHPIEEVQKLSKKINTQINQHKDPVQKYIKDQRDGRAVVIYKGIRAQNKINSLEQKYINGEFKGKSTQEMKYIIINRQKLQRAANSVI